MLVSRKIFLKILHQKEGRFCYWIWNFLKKKRKCSSENEWIMIFHSAYWGILRNIFRNHGSDYKAEFQTVTGNQNFCKRVYLIQRCALEANSTTTLCRAQQPTIAGISKFLPLFVLVIVICTWVLKNQVGKLKFQKLDF